MHNPCASAFNHSNGFTVMVKLDVIHDDDMTGPKVLAKQVLHILLKDFTINRAFDCERGINSCQRKSADH